VILRALASRYTPELRKIERQHIGTLPAYYAAVVFPILKKHAALFDYEWYDRLVAKLMANAISLSPKSPAGEVDNVYGLFPRGTKKKIFFAVGPSNVGLHFN